MPDQPYLLSSAGLDPSGGAGLFADLKTFESAGGLGLGICTALTYQNHWKFDGLQWMPFQQIQRQLSLLDSNYKVCGIKIGLIENMDTLEKLMIECRSRWPEALIVWDPIIKASAGYSFHDNFDENILSRVCESVDVITPNAAEAGQLSPHSDWESYMRELSHSCSIVVTSEKRMGEYIVDGIYQEGEKVTTMHQKISQAEKHGSGCVFSSALTAYLGKGQSLSSAYENALELIRKFLSSTTSRVGKVPSAASLSKILSS